MHKTVCSALMGIALTAGMCAGQALDEKGVVVSVGPQVAGQVPVALPFAGTAPEGSITLMDEASGTSCPATIREGELVFVAEGLKPSAKQTYKVTVAREAGAPKVDVRKKDGEDVVEVYVNGEHFTSYHYSNENKKPFLWPVYAEGPVGITRNYPMGTDDPAHNDHIHHKSIWTSYGDLNGVDCWGEGENSGYQHSGEVTWGSGDAYGWVHAKNVWQDKDHQPVIDEEREYRFYATPASGRLFDETVTFTASYGDVKWGDTKEGGIMAFRIRTEIEATRGRSGQIINATGQKGMGQCWGQPSPWCDYFGEIKGIGVRGIAVFDNPANLRYPTRWHVRDYGLNGANCFGLSYFTEREQKRKGEEPLNGDYLLEAGKSLTFDYRVLIHSGDNEAAQVADRCAAYLTPPQAEWAP